MIKMIVTDIDGTILPYDGIFTQGVLDCVEKLKKNDVKLVLATGRMHSSTTPIAKKLGLDTPIISYQGGLIKDCSGKTLYNSYLDKNIAKEVIAWAKLNNIHLNMYLNDRLYVEYDDEIIKHYIKGKFVDYTVYPFSKLEIENVNKLLAIDIHDPDKVSEWEKTLKRKYPQLYIVKSTPYFCEIGSKDAKKSVGVEFLRNYWGVSKEEVLTIGDQDNDIDLVKCGGIGVSMGNGSPDLKKCADYVTDTVLNDGFVKAVEKFVFN